jgi:hypothetical protein
VRACVRVCVCLGRTRKSPREREEERGAGERGERDWEKGERGREGAVGSRRGEGFKLIYIYMRISLYIYIYIYACIRLYIRHSHLVRRRVLYPEYFLMLCIYI